MSINRARKEAAKRLGLALEQKYRNLVLANPHDQDEVAQAAVDLGQCFNDNIEFVIWTLKTYGGLIPSPPEQLKKDMGAPRPSLPQLPSTLTNLLK